jgi:hypothetical protein
VTDEVKNTFKGIRDGKYPVKEVRIFDDDDDDENVCAHRCTPPAPMQLRLQQTYKCTANPKRHFEEPLRTCSTA